MITRPRPTSIILAMNSIPSPRRLMLVSDSQVRRTVIGTAGVRRYRLARVSGDRRAPVPAARKSA
jgi:hypothetical protein